MFCNQTKANSGQYQTEHIFLIIYILIAILIAMPKVLHCIN